MITFHRIPNWTPDRSYHLSQQVRGDGNAHINVKPMRDGGTGMWRLEVWRSDEQDLSLDEVARAVAFVGKDPEP